MSMLKFLSTSMPYCKERVLHRFKPPCDTTGEEDATEKVVVITGANSGLGKVVAESMAFRNATVVMACRDMAKAEQVAQEIRQKIPKAKLILVKLDLGDLNSVRECAREICSKVDQINILINNAGLITAQAIIEKTKDGFEKNMGTNHLGHFLFTLLLLRHIKKGAPSRIVTLSSLASMNAALDLDDLNMEKAARFGFFNMYPYNNSKLANALFSRELGKRLQGTGIRTYALCPGLVDTNLFHDYSFVMRKLKYFSSALVSCTPEQGAETTIYCALSKDVAEDSGKMYRFRHYWPEADEYVTQRSDEAKKLWDISEQLVGYKLTDAIDD